jgi:hypothetical protein
MLREVKFWARDILRGPNAKTLAGYYTFAVLVSLIVGAIVGFAVFGFLESTRL